MAQTKNKVNTIKSIGKKVANNGNASDYVYIPIGADAVNIDRDNGSTAEETFVKLESEKIQLIPVSILPESNIKTYPFIYALINTSEHKGIFYEYKAGAWIKYGSDIEGNGLWVGTELQIAEALANNEIKDGTIVIKILTDDDVGENPTTHEHKYVDKIIKEATYSETGLKKKICSLCGNNYEEEIPMLSDTNKPSGTIRIGSKAYTAWKDTVSFDTYYNENQSVTIEASDNESGVKEIAYYIATTGLDNAGLEAVEWTTYSGAFTIEPNNNYIVYAKITDNANNVTYICSDGIVLDNIPPVFNGMEDGGTYPVGTVLTLNDGETLTVNGTAVELTDNSYTFTEAMDNIQLSITDRAGNINTISVTLFQCYVPANAYENWRYTLDDSNKTITLERYIGSEEDVTVYKNYLVNGKLYDTRIGN